MDFNKSGASEIERLAEMKLYCDRVLEKMKQQHWKCERISSELSVESMSVDIIWDKDGFLAQYMLEIKYDTKEEVFYCTKNASINGRMFEIYILIKNEEDFDVYFNDVIINYIR
ncbi:hypothetical protein U8V72_15360 [Priestia filamentosa]|uniref:hypothetical protein n=1 Tax=Priestia filamentosa TaxID=1402861 RepID=UPI0005896142